VVCAGPFVIFGCLIRRIVIFGCLTSILRIAFGAVGRGVFVVFCMYDLWWIATGGNMIVTVDSEKICRNVSSNASTK